MLRAKRMPAPLRRILRGTFTLNQSYESPLRIAVIIDVPLRR